MQIKKQLFPSIVSHAVFTPMCASVIDFGWETRFMAGYESFGFFPIMMIYFVFILILPAILHGLIFWALSFRLQIPTAASVLLTVAMATTAYYFWIAMLGQPISKEIEKATIVMGVSSLIVSTLAYYFLIKKKAYQDGGHNSGDCAPSA